MLTPTQHHRLIILGSGPAGYTAAIYAARANLAPTIIAGSEIGGQLVKTHMVDNWPGEVNGVAGFELMQRMQQHVERFAVTMIYDQIVKVNLQQRPFLLESESKAYTCDALIIATGASPKYLGLPAEQAYLGKGVSTCATCDGYFYKGAKVAVVGGGNIALEDALYLAEIAKEVVLIHRRNVFSADEVLVKAVKEKAAQGKITIMWQHIVEDIIDNEDKTAVTSVKLKDLISGQIREEEIKGIFIAVGTKPNSEPFVGQLDMQDGYITIKSGNDGNFTATSIPGVFAAGDIANRFYRQAVTAAAHGCMAALDAKKYLTSGG